MKIFALRVRLLLALLLITPEIVVASTVPDIEFIILGVIASDSQHKGIALVKSKKTGKVTAYKVGARLEKRTYLTRVKRKHVEIKINNQPYKLIVGADVPTSIESKKGQRLATTSSGGIERSGDTLRVTASYKKHLIEENLSNVLMQAATEPYIENGQVVGFRLWEIDKGSIYEKAGFENGDIITHINGLPLNDAGAAIRTLNRLKKANNAEVTFRRGGVERNLKIEIN